MELEIQQVSRKEMHHYFLQESDASSFSWENDADYDMSFFLHNSMGHLCPWQQFFPLSDNLSNPSSSPKFVWT